MKRFSAHTYKERRKQLKSTLGKGRLLIMGNDNSSINFKDNWYPFRQDSTFLYYFGLDLPGLHGLIDIDKDREIIFGNELSIDDIIWTGTQPTLASLAAEVGIEEVLPMINMIKFVNHSLHFLPPYRPEQAMLLGRLFNRKTWKISKKYSKSLVKAVVKQRIYKSEEEIDELDRAAKISGEMHLKVMREARAGMKEHELVGIAASVAHKYNVGFAFPPILTRDGQTLHNHYYGNTLNEGDMVLFDGGCESEKGYAGDLTRTFPVSAKFSPLQKDLYEIVRKSYEAAVGALKPGVYFRDVHHLASLSMVEGLTALGFMKGDPEEAVENGAHTLFFQCGLGHMIGLDVHDMENLGEERVGYTDKIKKKKEFGWKSLRLGRALKEGFALTVEPGIYIIPELLELRKSQRKYLDFVDYKRFEEIADFGGIRIEDDFVITKDSKRLLGMKMPLSAEEVEKERAI